MLFFLLVDEYTGILSQFLKSGVSILFAFEHLGEPCEKLQEHIKALFKSGERSSRIFLLDHLFV